MNDDLIKAAIEAIERESQVDGAYGYMDTKSIIDLLEGLPVAQERKKGEWVYPSDIVGFGRCPHCNALWDYSLISNKFFRYCPRCGNGEITLMHHDAEEDYEE